MICNGSEIRMRNFISPRSEALPLNLDEKAWMDLFFSLAILEKLISSVMSHDRCKKKSEFPHYIYFYYAVHLISRQFLQYLRILGAVHRYTSDGLKIGGTCYKEPKLWTGTKYLLVRN
jgi:hypothetical protein